jgi:hypothetical protein
MVLGATIILSHTSNFLPCRMQKRSLLIQVTAIIIMTTKRDETRKILKYAQLENWLRINNNNPLPNSPLSIRITHLQIPCPLQC